MRAKLILLALLVCLMGTSVQAQEDRVLSIAVPVFFSDIFDEEFIADYESQNPGVRLSIVEANNFNVPSPVTDINTHLDEVRDYVSTADLVYVTASGNLITPEATTAGYYLDLAPIIAGDPSLDEADFNPAALSSFQWDGGTWALPTGFDPQVIVYEPAAFDEAGVPYPTPEWTIDDLENAARALAETDAAGNVTTPAFNLSTSYLNNILLRTLLGTPLYNDADLPNTPQLDTPEAAALLDRLLTLQEEGYVGFTTTGEEPLSIGNIGSFIQLTTDETVTREATLLPGNVGGLVAQGFAVSSGTRYPDDAYNLAKYLTFNADVSTGFGSVAARQSLESSEDGAVAVLRNNISETVLEQFDLAAQNALSGSEVRYYNYYINAFERAVADNLTGEEALAEIQQLALDNAQTAADRRDVDVVVVAQQEAPTLAEGKIGLTFGYGAFVSPIPNQANWDELIADFTSTDPEVGQITIETGQEAFALDTAAEAYDCFYLPFNAIPGADVTPLLNLDPFLDADPAFSRDDFVGNVLEQVQNEGRVYGLPITIEPSILQYNPELFDNVGAVYPYSGWTIEQFTEALQSLKLTDEDLAPFSGGQDGGNALLMLVAAYGGLPLDYRTTPETISYTDPATIEATQQVLDLAKEGYLEYEELGNIQSLFGGFGVAEDDTTPIFSDQLTSFGFNFGGEAEEETEESPYLPVTYPRGRDFSALTYGIGTAYISATSQNPEACYRWISTVAATPDLFTAMPARRSLINDPNTAATQGEAVVELYNEIDALLQDSTTVSLPSLFQANGSPTGFLAQLWLFQAWDAYVLEDAVLETELQTAQERATEFQACAAQLPPFNTLDESNTDEYIAGFADCAVDVDPSLEPLMNIIQAAGSQD